MVRSQPYRAVNGGALDRTRPLRFTFDGRTYEGYEGDTLASALLANGVRLVGRSFKYHRPRGVYGLGAEEPNALVRVGEGAAATPNLKATEVLLRDAMVVRSQNRWPSLSLDAGALAGALSRVLPAGFYYKTFMGPPGWWMLFEPFIRRAAGLGRPPEGTDPDRYGRRFAHCDVLVVGAGPAGLAAALAASSGGARVTLVDDADRLGGSLLQGPAAVDGLDAARWVGRAARTLDARPRVRVLRRALAFGYYDDNLVAVCEQVDGEGAPAPRERVWWIRAREVVLATGAVERGLVFPGNDRPGVMLASAARAYAWRHAVACGRRAVVTTNNDSAYDAIPALAGVGCEVAAVVDLRAGGPGEPAAALAEAAGARILRGYAVTATDGGVSLQGVEVRAVASSAEADGVLETRGPPEQIACDLLCVSGGWNPAVQLFSQSQGSLRWDAARAAFVPGQSRQRERSAGAAAGVEGLAAALESGHAAGEAAALACGLRASAGTSPRAEPAPERAPLRPVWRIAHPGGSGGKAFVDLQNDVTVDDVLLAEREGYRHPEHLKRYTTLGMGTDQGRVGGLNGVAVLASRLGRPVEAVGLTTFRAPTAPVTVGAIAGGEVGAQLAPTRLTPLHGWHEAAGAPMVPAGAWLRPRCYPRDGETQAEAIRREVTTVRGAVGLVDVSTLGKIEVRGRDAGAFLERIYANPVSDLAPGRVRYGLMLREDGLVFDDGTLARPDAASWYLTTTTANAARVLAHLERYAQTVWPSLAVHMVSVTDQWAAMAIAGPAARAVLARVCGAGAVSDGALPFMGCASAEIAGVTVRLLRITFSGELAYEVHVGADHGRLVWETLLEAGAAHGIAPYGTEAMGVLRIEKGHPAGPELDGNTTPRDLRLDRLLARKAEDFVGRRALERPGLVDPSRPRLVGLVSEDGQRIGAGAQLVTNPAAPKPLRTLGHVTSACLSPTLGRPIALALLTDGDARRGELLCAAAPVAGLHTRVRVTDPVFVDPKGRRPRG
ncbi:MAG: sarcosine oxidase subunit alpha family protein [Ectothiorhodospiraceae bacterium]|nr:sarcosine oxidase subunit alpha family protein [Ectothiorhodospiraceae bacterium]